MKACYRDDLGNVTSTAVSAATGITLDMTPPPAPLVVLASGAAAVRTTSVNLAVTCAGGTQMRVAVDGALDTESWQAFSASSTITLPSTEGSRTVAVQCRDALRNAGDTGQDQVTLDTTPPSLAAVAITGRRADGSAIIPDLGVTALTSVDVGVTATGAPVLMAVSTSSTALNCATASYDRTFTPVFTETINAAGVVQVCIRDEAGNTAGPVQDTITLDTAPPSCTINLAGFNADGTAAAANTTALPRITATASCGAESPVSMALMDSARALDCAAADYVPFAAGVPFALDATDGARNVRACFRDRVGNATATAVTAATPITLDMTPPTAPTLILQGGAEYATSTAITAAVTCAGAAQARISTDGALDAETWTTFTGSGSLSGTLTTGDGTKVVAVQCRDALRNTTQVVQGTVILDSGLPTAGTVLITGRNRDGTPNPLATATLDVEVTLSGYSADATSMAVVTGATAPTCATATYDTPVASVFTATVTSSGNVWVCVKDAAGNISATPSTDGITVDQAPPSCSIALAGFNADGTAAAANTTALPRITVTASCGTETPVSMALMDSARALDCAAADYVPFAAGSPFALDATDGARNVRACFRDRVGNATATAVTAATPITLDMTPPTAPTLILQGGAEYATSTAITAAVTCAGAAQARISTGGALDAETWTTFTGSGSLSGTLTTGDGTKVVAVQCRDTLLNTTQVAQATITLDTAVPVPGNVRLVGVNRDGTPNANTTALLDVEVYLGNTSADVVLMSVSTSSTAPTCATATYDRPFAPAFTETITTSGRIWLCVRDRAGNTSAMPGTDTITVDQAPPSCTVSMAGRKVDGTAAPSGFTARTEVDVTMSCGMETPTAMALVDSGVTLACDGASYAPYAPSTVVRLSSGDGAKNIRACFRDAVGNFTAASVSAATDIQLDQTPPANGFVELAGGAAFTADNTPPVEFYVEGATEYSLNGPTFTACATNPCASASPGQVVNLGSAPDGTARARMRFRDAVGNTSTDYADEVQVDTTPPSTPNILTISAVTTAAYVDLLVSTDSGTAPSGVAGYAIRVHDNAECSDAPMEVGTFTASEGWLTGLPAFRRLRFQAVAVDQAGNVSAESACKDALTGFTTNVMSAAEYAGTSSYMRTVAHRGFILTARDSGATEMGRFNVCDGRKGACGELGFAEANRDLDADAVAAGTTAWGRENAWARENGRLWWFNIRDTGTARHLHALRYDENGPGRELGQLAFPDNTGWWTHHRVVSNLSFPAGNNLQSHMDAASNGRIIAVAYREDGTAAGRNAVYVAGCLLGEDCTDSANWFHTDVITDAMPNYAPIPASSTHHPRVHLDAGEGHLWLTYEAVGTSGSQPAVAVVGCAIATGCHDRANWFRSLLPFTGGEIWGARPLEVGGKLWVAVLAQRQVPQDPAAMPVVYDTVHGVWLYRCNGGTGVSGNKCNQVADFNLNNNTRPTPILDLDTAGLASGNPVVNFEYSSGYLYLAAFSTTSNKLKFGRCNPESSGAGCLNAVDWERDTILDLAGAVQPPATQMVVQQGNPFITASRGDGNTYILEPYARAPAARAVVPYLKVGATRAQDEGLPRATWASLDTSQVDAYAVQYGSGLPFNEDDYVATTSLELNELVAVGTPWASAYGAVRVRRDMDTSAGFPVFQVQTPQPALQTATISAHGHVRYAETAACHVVAAVTNGAIQLSACARAGDCGNTASWASTTLAAANSKPVTSINVVATDTRAWVAWAYGSSTEQGEVWVENTALTACVPNTITDLSERIHLGPACGSDCEIPAHVSVGISANRALVAFDSHAGSNTPGSGDMRLARCTLATGCGQAMDWATTSITAAGGVNVAYSGGDLVFLPGTESVAWVTRVAYAGGFTGLQGWASDCAVSGCDAAADFTRFNLFNGAPPLHGDLHVNASGHLVYAGDGWVAWCRDPTGCNDARRWNRARVYAGAQDASAYNQLMGSTAGLFGTDLLAVAKTATGQFIGRCAERCWDPDAWHGGNFFTYDRLQSDVQGHFGGAGGVLADGKVVLALEGDIAQGPTTTLAWLNGMVFDFFAP